MLYPLSYEGGARILAQRVYLQTVSITLLWEVSHESFNRAG
jgi:hypothetical protein